MHGLRHTAAMTLLNARIDTSTIALWLGHEQERTTHVYLHADLALKQRTLDRITPPTATPAATEHPTPCSPSSKVCSSAHAAAPRRKGARHQHLGDALAFRPEQASRAPEPRRLLVVGVAAGGVAVGGGG